MSNKHEELMKQEDAYLLEVLGVKEGEIKTREDLVGRSFVCPQCKQTKPATDMIVLETPFAISHKNVEDATNYTVSQKILITCKECFPFIKVACGEFRIKRG
jgi:hypothetical protein